LTAAVRFHTQLTLDQVEHATERLDVRGCTLLVFAVAPTPGTSTGTLEW
jgi:hypothetical protein